MNLGARVKKRRLELSLTQEQLAEKAGVSISAINKLEVRDNKSSQKSLELAIALGVRIEWLSKGEEPMIADEGRIIAYDDIKQLNHLDIVEVPFVNNFSMAAGDGVINSDFLSTTSMPFYLNSLTKAGVRNAEQCLVGTAKGVSNEPYIPDGATIGIDTGCRNITSKEIYLITIDGAERVKQIIETGEDAIILRSFNDDKDLFPDVKYTYKEMVENNVTIQGRMFWCSWLRPL